jgi:hypothetical protein
MAPNTQETGDLRHVMWWHPTPLADRALANAEMVSQLPEKPDAHHPQLAGQVDESTRSPIWRAHSSDDEIVPPIRQSVLASLREKMLS